MSTNTDFDILNYSTEELINIIGLGGELPLTNEKIVERIAELKRQFEDKYEEDKHLIEMSNILYNDKRVSGRIDGREDNELFDVYFNPYGDDDAAINYSWDKWIVSSFPNRFREIFDNLMNTNGAFDEVITENEELELADKYKEALDKAFEARDSYILFFDEIGEELKEYRKKEFDTNYYVEEEENQKSMLEDMDDNQKILQNNNAAMPFWERTTFKGSPSFPKDYKNPISRPTLKKIINIDSQFRSIADPVICIRCPDTLELYQDIPASTTGGKPIVLSNSDGRILFAASYGGDLYKLDIKETGQLGDIDIEWDEITLSNSLTHKTWKDGTINYNGDMLALCNERYIWYSRQYGISNTWERGHTNGTTSDIQGSWTAITSDFTGQMLFACRESGSVGLTTGGVCFSDDYGTNWTDISGTIIYEPDPALNLLGNNDLNQEWIDIELTTDENGNLKVYGIIKNSNKYYILLSENNGTTWKIINKNVFDYKENVELINVEWTKIKTNFYGTKVFAIADNYHYIWRSFNTGKNWSRIDDITGDFTSLTCSLDGLKLSVWDSSRNQMFFSENGGSVWNDPKNDINVGSSQITISHDGDRILGLSESGKIFTSKKCVERDVSLFDTPSNFTINLNEKVENVISIALKYVELPHSWDVFSRNEGTCLFYVKRSSDTEPFLIEIPEGSYYYNNQFDASLNLITALNNACNSANVSLNFSYRSSHKIAIENTGSTTTTILWHYEGSNEVCGRTGTGTKANYNLGWLLGFRKTLSYLKGRDDTNGKNIVVGTAKLNLRGTKYVYIALDEFSNNKPPDSCISYENNAATFSMPNYFVKTTMGQGVFDGSLTEDDRCYVPPDPPAGTCGKRIANPDSIDNLTRAQRYTIQNLREAISVPKRNQYKSPIIPNFLYKMQLRYNTTVSPAFQETTDRIDLLEYTKRDYFGPITLRKFHIRLFNERGVEIDLNENNWSFTLVVEQLYNN